MALATGASGDVSVDGLARNETLLRILDAGSACLARFGNEKTSIQDVADAAGVGRATIYRYYPDRAHLFQAITDHEHAQELTRIRLSAAETTGLEEAIVIVVEVLAEAALRFRTRDHLRNHDRGLAQYLFFQQRDRLRPLREMVRPYVQRAHEAGEIAPELSVEEVIEWIVITLGTIPTLPHSQILNLDDPVAVGRFFARLLCRGLNIR
jgi:AcrR family transcriptional regulator